MTIEEAKKLTTGQIVYHKTSRNADGTPRRWTINGKVKLWKRDKSRVQVPIKHGLYSYAYITEYNCKSLCLTEEEANES